VAIITPAGIPKTLLLRAQYSPFADGRPRLTGLLVDITEKKRAEQRLAVVARELQHRVKNSLSVVHAIASQSLRIGVDLEAARDAFLGRIAALAAATDLLFEKSSQTVDLHKLVDQITNPYRGGGVDPFKVEGPGIAVPSQLVTPLSMALHELCTNGLKHGALSVSGGRVDIRWTREGDMLALAWEESGGPKVSAPDRQGFGTKLLEKVLPGDIGGRIELEFRAGGVRCSIRAHLG
jgi:two-component sensor histidine kinase